MLARLQRKEYRSCLTASSDQKRIFSRSNHPNDVAPVAAKARKRSRDVTGLYSVTSHYATDIPLNLDALRDAPPRSFAMRL